MNAVGLKMPPNVARHFVVPQVNVSLKTGVVPAV